MRNLVANRSGSIRDMESAKTKVPDSHISLYQMRTTLQYATVRCSTPG